MGTLPVRVIPPGVFGEEPVRVFTRTTAYDENKTCTKCNKKFKSKQRSQKFCSRRCKCAYWHIRRVGPIKSWQGEI